MTASAYRIRPAVVTDATIIAHQRAAMFHEMGLTSREEAAQIETAALPQLREALASGAYLGWVVEVDDKVVAGGGIQMRRLLPRPGSLNGGEEAYILNVYTEPEYRRRSLARKLIEAMIAWARERGCARITLHPSEEGRPLYQSLGFERTQEMLLK